MLHSASGTPCSSHHQPLWSCAFVAAGVAAATLLLLSACPHPLATAAPTANRAPVCHERPCMLSSSTLCLVPASGAARARRWQTPPAGSRRAARRARRVLPVLA